MNIKIFNTKDFTSKMTMPLDDKVFGVKPHQDVMHEVIVSQQASLRQGTHGVKTRGQVSGGGRKPWKQKGTGRARQGSIRAPQWTGGGVVFGPTTNANYERKVNKKAYKLGIRSILSQKLLSKEIMVIDKLELTNFSTKKAAELISKLELDNKKTVFITEKLTGHLLKSFNNIPRVRLGVAHNINPLLLVNNDVLVITKPSINIIQGDFR